MTPELQPKASPSGGSDPVPEHGTRAAYLSAPCRCALCRLANRTYATARARDIAMGRWKPYVDAAQTRRHLELLRKHGYGIDRIATLAGVPRSTVRRLLRADDTTTRRPGRIRPETARRLLAVDDSDARVAARTSVDAAPTRQRITELRAAGHTLPDLAGRLGRTPTSLARTLRRASVTVSTDRAVAELHRQLSPPPPRPVNGAPRGFA